MRILAMLRKELVDGLRDRRALSSAFLGALVGPVVLFFMLGVMAANQREESLQPVALCGKGQAVELLDHLRASGLAFEEGAKVCLDIPDDYAARLAKGETARLTVVGDLGSAAATVGKLQREIGAYSRSLAMQRLIARGVAPSAVAPIGVDVHSTNQASRAAGALGGGFILYLVFAPFLIVSGMASDTTAGERERHSLEPLLTHPISGFQIVLGKFLALSIVNLLGTAVCIAVSLFLLARSAAPEVGLRIETSFTAGATALLWMTPLCLLVAAVVLVLGLFAKTFKEAQQLTMLTSLLPVVAFFAMMNRPATDIGPWPLMWEMKALAVPLLNSNTVFPPFIMVAVIEAVLIGVALAAAARMLRGKRFFG